VTQTIGPVCRDLEIDHRLSPLFDRRKLEAAEADLSGNGLDVIGHRHDVTQPVVDDPHSGNCSRNLRSFS